MADSTALTMIGDLALNQGRATRAGGAPWSAATRAEARDKAEEFEALFLAQMLRPAFDQLETDPPFGGGNAEKIWRTQLIDHYGKAMVKRGGIGIAGAIEREILKLQETP